MFRMLTQRALDDAIQANLAQLGRVNKRSAKCVCCYRLLQAGKAYKLWIDGHARGFICFGCSVLVPTRAQRQRIEAVRRESMPGELPCA